MSTFSSPAASFAATRPVAPPCVLLLMDDLDRIVELRRDVQRLIPAARVESDLDPLDGLLTAARMPADLVIVDAMLAAGSAHALIRHIARVAPDATVLLFDDLADGHEQSRRAHPWRDVEACVARWRDARGAVPAR